MSWFSLAQLALLEVITIIIKQYLQPGENWSLWVSNWMWIKRPRVSLLTTRSVLNLSYEYIWNELININWFGGFVIILVNFPLFYYNSKVKICLKKQNKSKIKYDHFILTLYDVQNNMPSRNTRKQQRETWSKINGLATHVCLKSAFSESSSYLARSPWQLKA